MISVNFVRKCAGKQKQGFCQQGGEHDSTRWECPFECNNKDEFRQHCKNICRRVRWREMVEKALERDPPYRCVYFSTDRHHVLAHYQKGNSAITPPTTPQTSPQLQPPTQPQVQQNQQMRFKMNASYQQGVMSPLAPLGLSRSNGSQPHSPRTRSQSTKWVNFGISNGGIGKKDEEFEYDPNISPELAARELKRLRQDNLVSYFDAQTALTIGEASPNGMMTTSTDSTPSSDLKDSVLTIPDNLKTEELIDSVEKKLELSHEMCALAIDRLHKQGFVIVAGLRTLKKEGWERLDLPLAIEEELKTQLAMRGVANWNYGTQTYPTNNNNWALPMTNNISPMNVMQNSMSPTYYNMQTYNGTMQPVYFSYQYENSDDSGYELSSANVSMEHVHHQETERRGQKRSYSGSMKTRADKRGQDIDDPDSLVDEEEAIDSAVEHSKAIHQLVAIKDTKT
eukprot:TRINITY_DN470_c1_g1_i1.p1 TRINITY_DN470_c1_g1~~TRINITY_DN470_c1_g1_i1.p1  ORF type:complete len:453 (-),score=88.95 TRINITY_DN470_c1_g1_i1:580-1938(-)